MTEKIRSPKGQRKTQDPCLTCFLHKSLCICSEIPKLDLKTKVSLIVHIKELKRTTNTGRLAIEALMNSQMKLRGEIGNPLDLTSLLTDDYQSLLFYPSEEAQELTPDFVKSFNKPIQLLVPDGNWRQASKVHYRHTELKDVPRVKISAPNPSPQHMRKENTEEGMATLQAIAAALTIIEGPQIGDQLMNLYQLKLSRTLKGRGQLL